MTNASGQQPAFVEALQCISDLPLNPREALGDRQGRDPCSIITARTTSGAVDRRPRPPKRVEHAPRQFSMLEPEIGLPILFAGIVFGSKFRSKQAQCGVKMNEISAKLTELLLRSCDQPGNLGSFGLTNADTTWLSAMFHPRSRNDQGDYCRQADLMSAQRLVCLRHDCPQIQGRDL